MIGSGLSQVTRNALRKEEPRFSCLDLPAFAQCMLRGCFLSAATATCRDESRDRVPWKPPDRRVYTQVFRHLQALGVLTRVTHRCLGQADLLANF